MFGVVYLFAMLSLVIQGNSSHPSMRYRVDMHSLVTRDQLISAKRLLDSKFCEHIYLDVGTNIGIQIRKLYEPQMYAKATVHPIFNKYFGEDRKRVCAFGFEPNPKHSTRLQQIMKLYNQLNERVVIFTQTAASTSDANQTFYTQPYEKPENSEHGASLVNWDRTNTMQPTLCDSIRLADFIRVVFNRPGRNIGSHIVMKIDIEGAEFFVLSDLLTTGTLCKLSAIMAEYHNSPIPNISRYQFEKVLRYIVASSPNCRNTTLYGMDDETYAQDHRPIGPL
jgi:FkbM family methyltransferase